MQHCRTGAIVRTGRPLHVMAPSDDVRAVRPRVGARGDRRAPILNGGSGRRDRNEARSRLFPICAGQDARSSPAGCSPSSPSSASRSPSRRTPRCSRSSTRCSCGRCRSRTPIGSSSIAGRHPETGPGSRCRWTTCANWRRLLPSLESVAAYSGRTATLTDGGEPERIASRPSPPISFRCWASRRSAATASRPADDRAPAPAVVLISDSLWRRRYQQEESVIGRAIRLDDVPYTIVGVMPPKFRFRARARSGFRWPGAWRVGARTRERLDSSDGSRRTRRRRAPTRNCRHASCPQRGSRRRATGVARPDLREHESSAARNGRSRAHCWAQRRVLLLLACVNVANLLLARGAYRRREMARARVARRESRPHHPAVADRVRAARAVAAAWRCRSPPTASAGSTTPCRRPSRSARTTWTGRSTLRTFLYAIGVALVTGLAFGWRRRSARRGASS